LNQAEGFPRWVLRLFQTCTPTIKGSGEKKGRTMNPLLQCKPTIPPLFIAGVLACFGLLPKAQAVVPAPDGGYPGSNTAEGTDALFFLTSGVANTALGFTALHDDNIGSFNTAVGSGALLDNTSGSRNTAVGGSALAVNMTGGFNTAVGQFALFGNFMGNSNTAVGHRAGFNLSTGSGNVCIGAGVPGVAGESNTTRIRNVYSSVATARAVYVNSDNKIGTLSSSRRYKEQIKPMDKASEAILWLKPVTFRYKKEIDPMHCLGFGLIAEEVAQVNADLVTCDADGKPETVRYEAVNAMLLNEFLKEHRAVQEQQKEIDALRAELKEQRALIQKVNDKVEFEKPAPQTVLNNR
jgi:hypothetical protein